MITSREIKTLSTLIEQAEGIVNNDVATTEEMAVFMLENGARVIPCKIGDRVFAIRNYGGKPQVYAGHVSEMCFIKDMKLSITVRGVARGTWGKNIFATREECEKRISEICVGVAGA